MNTSKQNLELFQRNPSEFLSRFVTVDERWIHQYQPQTKQPSKQWVGPGERGTHCFDCCLVFWDTRVIIFIDCLLKDKTITGEYYAALLD